MFRNELIAALFSCILLFAGCGRIMLGGFWKSFHKGQIKSDFSDHGPWGGHTEMLWQSDREMSFPDKEVIAFAKAHGCRLVDSAYRYSGRTGKWANKGAGVEAPFEDQYFRQWASGDMRALRFTSNWTKESPAGSANYQEAYYYVLLNEDNSEMMLFYFWGD